MFNGKTLSAVLSQPDVYTHFRTRQYTDEMKHGALRSYVLIFQGMHRKSNRLHKFNTVMHSKRREYICGHGVSRRPLRIKPGTSRAAK